MSKIERKSFHEERYSREERDPSLYPHTGEWTVEKARELDNTLYQIEKSMLAAVDTYNESHQEQIDPQIEQGKEDPGLSLKWEAQSITRQVAIFVKYQWADSVPLGIFINKGAWKFDIDKQGNKLFRSTLVKLADNLGFPVKEYYLKEAIDHAILETSKIRAEDLTRVIQME